MNHDGVIQFPDMAAALNEEADGTGTVAAIQLELERSRRELGQLQNQLAQMEGLFALLADAFFVVECDGRIVDANPAASALLGYSKKEFLTMCPWDFVTSVPRDEILTTIENLKNGAPLSVKRLCCAKNGEEKVMALRLRRNYFGGRDLVVVTARDVTQEQRAATDLEKALKEIKGSVIESKRATAALLASEKLAREQAEVLTLALDALARESDWERIVEYVLRTVTTRLDAFSNSVWLRNEVSGLMVFEFALEDGKFKTKAETTIAAVSPSMPVQAISPWPEIFRTGKPSVLEDIREGPDFPWRSHVLAQGIITILVVPMMIAGKVEGMIGLRFTQKRTFCAEELELSQVLANQAMLAIQLARLSGQNRQSATIEERNRIARDIHDTLAQGFTGVILHLEAAEEAMARKRLKVVSGHLRGAGEIARDGLREARRSVQALRPLALEEKKLAEALAELLAKRTAGTALQAKFTLQGEPRELPSKWEANILRIGQEVLTNVFRHARATEFSAVLIFGDREISLTMHDNGCGFDSTGKFSGFGLGGMAERSEDMGGRLTIQSANGRGTTISVVVPMPTFTEQEKS
jgi:PAS domain S-box-containing protein